MKRTFFSTAIILAFHVQALGKDSKPAPVSLATPSIYGPLNGNSNPINFVSPIGNIYVTGALTALGLWQDNPVSGNDGSTLDLSNAQIVIQKADGPLQFYTQIGGYSLPSLGTPYIDAQDTTNDFFGPVPVAYIKFAPNDNFSIQAGKLYTLVGTENTFTFQNANIERGLLWNQTSAISRGIQVNVAQGPISASFAITDGFYSGTLDWLSGLATYTIDKNNSVTVIASGNIARNAQSTLETPLAQNNSQIYDLSFTHTSGAWTFTPTLQYTSVPQDATIGLTNSAASYGAGLTAKYAFNDNWSLAARGEYVDTTGGTNIAYGPGSNAWSATLTPTYQDGPFFARGEVSYVRALDITPGAAFGASGNGASQARFMVETGILF